jgi:hypothetical protein
MKLKLKTRITLALLMVEKGGEGKEEDIYIYSSHVHSHMTCDTLPHYTTNFNKYKDFKGINLINRLYLLLSSLVKNKK